MIADSDVYERFGNYLYPITVSGRDGLKTIDRRDKKGRGYLGSLQMLRILHIKFYI